MHKSLSTTTMNMQKSQLRPKIAQSQMTTPNAKSQVKFPQIQNTKQMDDNYVEKLHNHINLLSDQIKGLKGKQQDFQGSMMQMMTKDKNEFIDNPIDAQEKYKKMKQKYQQLIHELETEQIQIRCEAESLKKQKEYLDKLLKHEEENNILITNSTQDKIKESQDRTMSSKQKESLLAGDLAKLEDQLKQTKELYNKKRKQRMEKDFKDTVAQENYDREMELEQQDYDEKVKVFEKLKADIKRSNDTQDQDIRYVELKEKNQELRAMLSQAEQERDKLFYELKELEQRVKLGDEDKDFEAQERRRMRDELQKYNDIYEEIVQRNNKRIEAKVQNSDSANLRKIKVELTKVERQVKDLKDEYKQRQNEFEKQRIEMMNKDDYLKQVETENQQMEQRLAQIYSKVNNIKEDYDSRMGNMADQQEHIRRQLKEEDYYKNELNQTEEQHAYLKAKTEFYQDNVNLDEELRRVKIDDLKNTIGANNQFNESIVYLQNNWQEMQKFAKQR